MKKKILPFFCLLFIGFAFAHQPRLVFQQPIGQIVNVKNPEISQAFYGQLSGQSDIYQIVSVTGFVLYVNLVVPDISGSRTDFTVDIIEWNSIVYTRLDGRRSQWTGFFEKFAGDNYLQWPSIERSVGSGIYTIRVSNWDNQGKYSLAIGKKESFPIKEMIHTFKVMPKLKMVFFQKPRYTVYWNYVWWFLWVIIVIIIVLMYAGVKFVKYIRSK